MLNRITFKKFNLILIKKKNKKKQTNLMKNKKKKQKMELSYLMKELLRVPIQVRTKMNQ